MLPKTSDGMENFGATRNRDIGSIQSPLSRAQQQPQATK